MAKSKFGTAFNAARKAGKKEFTFGGKKYNTKVAATTPKKAPTPSPRPGTEKTPKADKPAMGGAQRASYLGKGIGTPKASSPLAIASRTPTPTPRPASPLEAAAERGRNARAIAERVLKERAERKRPALGGAQRASMLGKGSLLKKRT